MHAVASGKFSVLLLQVVNHKSYNSKKKKQKTNSEVLAYILSLR